MDLILTPLMIILGKYALDKGVELGKAAGPKALETAKEMYALTLEHLRRKPEGKVIADGFERAPGTYEKPLEEQLTQATQTDPNFRLRLKALYEQYETAAKEHAAAAGTTYQGAISGTGSIAQGPGASAATAGEGGIAIGGSVGGDVTLSDRDKPK